MGGRVSKRVDREREIKVDEEAMLRGIRDKDIGDGDVAMENPVVEESAMANNGGVKSTEEFEIRFEGLEWAAAGGDETCVNSVEEWMGLGSFAHGKWIAVSRALAFFKTHGTGAALRHGRLVRRVAAAGGGLQLARAHVERFERGDIKALHDVARDVVECAINLDVFVPEILNDTLHAGGLRSAEEDPLRHVAAGPPCVLDNEREFSLPAESRIPASGAPARMGRRDGEWFRIQLINVSRQRNGRHTIDSGIES